MGATVDFSERTQILEKVRALAVVEHSSFDDEVETRRKLNEHGIPDELIAKQLTTLSSNTANHTAVLTSYSLLHSLQHLDTIRKESPRYADAADAVITLYRCAEICLYNIGALSDRIVSSIKAGNVSRAMSHARWRAGFHEVLYQLSGLAVEVGSGNEEDGAILDIRYSRIHFDYLERTRSLQAFLTSAWPEEVSSIFGKDLDDPRRYVLFNELVNSTDERIWSSRLSAVRLPGVKPLPRETPVALYDRVINSKQIELMAKALETKADTDLLPFRAVHQVTETIASYVNLQLCDAVQLLLSDDGDLDAVTRKVTIGNRLLTTVDNVMKLLLRALTPNAYQDIRPVAGMVKDTSSVLLRKTLFNTTYPLLLRAYRVHIMGSVTELADDDAAVSTEARALAQDRAHAELMRQLVVLFQHVRTWGDEGRTVRASDPIAPFYRAILGTEPPAVNEKVSGSSMSILLSHDT